MLTSAGCCGQQIRDVKNGTENRTPEAAILNDTGDERKP